MIKDSSTESWNKVAEEWIPFAQTNDYRLYFIMPFTLDQLGDVFGKKILDIGCGEGGYSRELTKKGATVTAVDCAKDLIDYSISKADEEKLTIYHYLRNSNNLYDISDNTFDIVLSSMMLMDCEDFEGTIQEITRVLKPSGILFASISHPCFTGKDIRWQNIGGERKFFVEDYFYPVEWKELIASNFRTPVIFRHRTLQDYIKTFVKCGLTIIDLSEPIPSEEQKKMSARLTRLQKVPMFLFWKLKKNILIV